MLKIANIIFMAIGVNAQACSDTLSLAPKTLPFTHLDYSATPSEADIGKGWKSFFVNSEETKCPITQCILKTGPTCSEIFVGDLLSIG